MATPRDTTDIPTQCPSALQQCPYCYNTSVHCGNACVAAMPQRILPQCLFQCSYCRNVAAMLMLLAMPFSIAAIRIAAILKRIAAMLPLLHHCGNALWHCRNTPIFSRCTVQKFGTPRHRWPATPREFTDLRGQRTNKDAKLRRVVSSQVSSFVLSSWGRNSLMGGFPCSENRFLRPSHPIFLELYASYVMSLQHVPMLEYAGCTRAWTRYMPRYVPSVCCVCCGHNCVCD